MLTFALFALPFTLAAVSGSDSAATILAMERAALDRSDQGDAEAFLAISDPGVTYFDPFLDAPIHGREALTAYYRKVFTGGGQGSGEMTNAKVQLAGGTAILTFNYTSRAPNRPDVRWNATEVYRHTKDGWRILHTHWSLLKPGKPE